MNLRASVCDCMSCRITRERHEQLIRENEFEDLFSPTRPPVHRHIPPSPTHAAAQGSPGPRRRPPTRPAPTPPIPSNVVSTPSVPNRPDRRTYTKPNRPAPNPPGYIPPRGLGAGLSPWGDGMGVNHSEIWVCSCGWKNNPRNSVCGGPVPRGMDRVYGCGAPRTSLEDRKNDTEIELKKQLKELKEKYEEKCEEANYLKVAMPSMRKHALELSQQLDSEREKNAKEKDMHREVLEKYDTDLSYLHKNVEEWTGRTLKLHYILSEMKKVGLSQSEWIFDMFEDFELPEVPISIRDKFIPTTDTNVPEYIENEGEIIESLSLEARSSLGEEFLTFCIQRIQTSICQNLNCQEGCVTWEESVNLCNIAATKIQAIYRSFRYRGVSIRSVNTSNYEDLVRCPPLYGVIFPCIEGSPFEVHNQYYSDGIDNVIRINRIRDDYGIVDLRERTKILFMNNSPYVKWIRWIKSDGTYGKPSRIDPYALYSTISYTNHRFCIWTLIDDMIIKTMELRILNRQRKIIDIHYGNVYSENSGQEYPLDIMREEERKKIMIRFVNGLMYDKYMDMSHKIKMRELDQYEIGETIQKMFTEPDERGPAEAPAFYDSRYGFSEEMPHELRSFY